MMKRPSHGTDATGQRHQEREPERGGVGRGGGHRVSKPSARRGAQCHQRQPANQAGRQVGRGQSDVSTLAEEHGLHGQGGVGRPSPEEAHDEEGASQGGAGGDRLGEGNQESNGQGATQVDQEGGRREMSGRGGEGGTEEVAGQGSQGAPESNGQDGAQG